MSRPRAGYIGFNRVPAASALNSAASGIWTLREAEAMRRAGTWPSAFTSPTILAGLQLWLDASDASTLFDATSGGSLVAADGGVARWEDKSSNSRHATQATSGDRPLRKTAVQGGRDVLRFDGSSDRLSISDSRDYFSFLHRSDATVFVVFLVAGTNPNNAQSVLDNCDATGQMGFNFGYDDRSSRPVNDRAYAYAGIVNNYAYGIETENNKFPPGTFKVVTARVQAANGTASQRARLYVNGTIDASVNSLNGSPTAISASNLHIGCSINSITSAASSFLNGDIAEIIIYDSALSDGNRALVENYAMTKWAIT